VLVKIWLHIGQDEQRRRLRLRAKHAPGTRQARSLDQNRRYEEYLLAAEETLARTGSGWAPWTVVEATDPFYAWWQVCETTAAAMADGLQARGIDLDRLGEQVFADGDAAGAP
jgi:polyphosphate kinase 2 (PPK2 family)